MADSDFLLDRIISGTVTLMERARDLHPEIWHQSPVTIRQGVKAQDWLTVDTPAILITINGRISRVAGPRAKGRERLRVTFTAILVAQPVDGGTEKATARLFETFCKVVASNRQLRDLESSGSVILPQGQLVVGDAMIGVTLDEPQRGVVEFELHAEGEFTAEPLSVM